MNMIEINRRSFLKGCLAVTAAGLTGCKSSHATKPPVDQLKSPLLLWVGTYADNNADSVFLYSMDADTGALESAGAFKAGANPSFLAPGATGRFLYAVNEGGVSAGEPGGAVSAFSVEAETKVLTLLNRQPSKGNYPCHLSLDRSGRFVLVANYGSGTIAVLPVAEDGRLNPAVQTVQHKGKGANPGRQEGPHAHFIAADPDNRFVLACDLGIDKVLVYGFDSAAGGLTPAGEAVLPPGSGPRHLDFHPNGRFVYVISELTSTMSAFSYAAETGTLTRLQTLSTLPEGFKGSSSCAEVFVHPNGKFVYGSNRGHDSIAMFTVDEATGQLTAAGHESTRGRNPRSFVIDPDGAFLLAANQDGNSVVVFRVDQQTGGLTYIQTITVPKPVCLKLQGEESQS